MGLLLSPRFLIVLALALGGGLGPARASTAPSDSQIAAWVRGAVDDDPRVVPHDVSVAVEGGIVTLSGRLDSLASRRYAVREAEKIRGVRGVVDELEVAAGLRSDEALAATLRERIARSAVLGGRGIETEVAGGVARLSGAVPSAAERAYAQLVAEEVPGVQGVRNDLRIEPSAVRPDPEIRDDVRASLDRDVFLTGLPIEVKVRDGAVTLSGRVASARQKSRAVRDAQVVANVRRVDAALQVDWHQRRVARAARPRLSDADVAASVLQELRQDLRIGGPLTVDVTADRGRVTLRGRVATLYQRRLADRDARDVVGVVAVADELQVASPPRSDTAIADDVRFQLASDGALHAAGLGVSVKDGVVTLSGRVDDRFATTHAADLASRVEGVRTVEDRITVSDAPVADAVLRDRLAARLDGDAETHWVAPDIQVEVDHGLVTLRGLVDTFAEREEAARVVLTTRGVLGVTNLLAVKGVESLWAQAPRDDPTRAYGEGSPFGPDAAWGAPIW